MVAGTRGRARFLARDLLVLAVHPQLLSARIVRARVLFQEGRDWAAAEQALRAVLENDPSNTEVRRNLDTVLRNTNRGV